MKNFVSFNAKYYKKDRVNKIQDHNTRKSEIDYLIEPLENNITDTNLQKEFNAKYLQMKTIATKNRSYVKEYGNHIVEAVVAISEDAAKSIIVEDGNAQRLYKGFKQIAQDIKDRYGLEPLQVSLHLDEGHEKQVLSDRLTDKEYSHNIHAHITFLNYDFKEQRSVLRTLKKSDWEKMQDISADAFKKHGMSFQRGSKKLFKGKDHLERNEYVLQQQQNDIKTLQQNIDEIISNKKDMVNNLKLKRKELTYINIDIIDKKALYKEITKEQTILRNDIKQLKLQKKNILDYELKDVQIDDLEKSREKLMQEAKLLLSKNQRLSNRVTLIEKENQTLQSNVDELKQDISLLERKYKFNYKEWKASRESNFSKFKNNRENLHTI